MARGSGAVILALALVALYRGLLKANGAKKDPIVLKMLRVVNLLNNPRAHKNKIGTSPPPQTQNTPLPKTRILWTWLFLQDGRIFPAASIKLAQPFPAPELRTKILRTRGSENCKPEWSWRSLEANWWWTSGEVWKEIFELLLLGKIVRSIFHQNSTANFTIKLHYEVLGCGGPYKFTSGSRISGRFQGVHQKHVHAFKRTLAKPGEVWRNLVNPQRHIHENLPDIHWSAGEGPPHIPQSSGEGAFGIWVAFRMCPRFDPQPQRLPIFHLILGGKSESLLRKPGSP